MKFNPIWYSCGASDIKGSNVMLRGDDFSFHVPEALESRYNRATGCGLMTVLSARPRVNPMDMEDHPEWDR